ncbi:hypothetical protein RSOLAG22IIIB_01076 [Rhizoctonia solani]|uniref:Alphaherpesvirus glycoprotein E domain protein n=1 Tax=Rhizoctonia solani TaxID=456999 RepID=A0A0K6G226_9AGAM|nr:hypothetical protein RSOLAG22IIIB_01076 [Rhizoctonia solani]
MTPTRYIGLRRLATIGVLLSTCTQASAFSFTYSSPVQCDDLNVSWVGGTAPFSLMITPFYSTPQNISIPASAFNGTHGSYTTTLRVTGKSNQGRFLLTMSDATGVGTGGTSGILTASTGSNSCNTTDPGTDFVYSLDRSLQQCRPYTWNHYETAVQPITITGLIPLGKTFVLNAPLGDSFSWTANIASGTNIVFIVTDAQGRQGGSSDLYTVAASDDTSCITNDSPGSTAQSATSTSTPTATSVPSTVPANQNSNAAVIGSSIAGGVVFLAALTSLIWFFFLRKRKQRNDEEDDSMRGINAGKRRGRSVDLLPEDRSAHSAAGTAVRYPLPSPHTGDALDPERGRSVYEPDPYVLPPPPLDARSYFSRSNHHEDELSELGLGDPVHRRVMSTSTHMSGMSKAQMAAAASASGSRAHGSQRFILHTDAGEIEDEEVVELPPMYTQVQPRRTPPAPESTTSGAPSGSATVDDPLRTG